MALQIAFRKLVSRSYEKGIPGILAAVRKTHDFSNKLRSTHCTENFILSHSCVFLQNAHNYETVASSFPEGRKCNTDMLVLSEHRRFLDLDLLNSELKRVYVPSTSLNKIKIYEEKHRGLVKTISDPLCRDFEVIHIPFPGQHIKKEAHRMINIRKRKMRIHRRRKLWKKMKFIWERLRHRREIRKETDFQNELLTQIDEAQSFHAEKYVKGILDKIRYHKKPPTPEERYEQYRLLIKKNKSNTRFIKPRFDD